jgi:inosine-uridine nucleoside N-ribohydrolase
MTRVRVHVDTDPGLDDVLALAFALACPELEVVGISTVSGNAPIEVVTENAQRFLALAGEEIPIGRGAAGPLALARIDATHFHGLDGRRGVAIAGTPLSAELESARAVLARSLREQRVARVIALGPLSNVAALIAEQPELFAGVELVWMGGSLGRGNVTHVAEFNAFADPRAVRVVLESGVALRVVGLEVTEQVALRARDLAAAALPATPRGRVLESSLHALICAERGLSGEPAAYLHDPCAIAAAFAPGWFEFEPRRLRIRDEEGAERGRLRHDPAARHEALYATGVRASELRAFFLSRVAKWASAGIAAS